MTRAGSSVRRSWFSKNEEGRYRLPVVAAVTTILAVGVLPAAGIALAHAQGAPTRAAVAGITGPPPTPTTITLTSGQTTNAAGEDPNTSFCFQPTQLQPTETGMGLGFASGSNPETIATDPPNPHNCNTAAGVPAHPYVVSPQSGWQGSIAGAKWIGSEANGGDTLLNTSPPQWYIYDRTLPTNACGASLTGTAFADNVVGVFLDRAPVSPLNSFPLASQTDTNGGSADQRNFGQNGAPPLSFSSSLAPNTNYVVDFVVLDTTEPVPGPANGTGVDYSMTVTPTPCGTLKICKVAGSGVTGQNFTFNVVAGGPPQPQVTTVVVPAGPAPGGYCKLAGTYVSGTQLSIGESVPNGDQVTSIATSAAVFSPNSGGGITGTIGTGVTEVTFTDASARSGFFEICKQLTPATPTTTAVFHFTVNGSLTIAVPAGSCSPAINVPAGNYVVKESLNSSLPLAGCTTVPASALVVPCNPVTGTATIHVASGGISSETILNVTDGVPAPTCATSDWTKLSPTGLTPSARRGDDQMAYDAATGQMILFGGFNSSGSLSDTWVWTGTQWQQYIPTNSPPATAFASMAYDGATGQLILFGSNGNETWNWTGSNWTQLTPSHNPGVRDLAQMAYDGATGQLILFGGVTGTTRLNDTWAWTGSDWKQLSPASPLPVVRQSASMAYDGASSQMILFGGDTTGPSDRNDTWTGTGTGTGGWTWTQRSPTNIPGVRQEAAMAYDPGCSRVVLFSGLDTGNDTWAWTGTDWAPLTPTHAPPAREEASMAYDPATAQIVLFGGETPAFVPVSDTWEFAP